MQIRADRTIFNYSFGLGLDPRSTTLVRYRYCVSVVYLGATWNVS
jgi:hypothetical protein